MTIDNYAVGQSAAQHFLRRGHERLAVVAPIASSRSRSLRAVGFQDSVSGELNPGSHLSMVTAHGETSYEGGAQATLELFEGADHPTAVFVVNDTMIAGVMQTLAALGLQRS